jgi:hypothetical protein
MTRCISMPTSLNETKRMYTGVYSHKLPYLCVPVFTLISYNTFLKQKYYVDSSCYCKHTLEIKGLAHCENQCVLYY